MTNATKFTGLTNTDITELLNQINSKGCTEYTTIDGGLTDNVFIDDLDISVTIDDEVVKPYKHMYAVENVLNTWSSDIMVIFTDSDEEYYSVKERYLQDCLKRIYKDGIEYYDEDIVEEYKLQLDECKHMIHKVA